jgi:nucleoside-diphosphate-sugar epimerase
MNILLTGITGNLGFEIARSLNKREVKVLPVVRDISSLDRLGLSVEDAIEVDLTSDNLKIDSNKIDCIVHSAGNVHFEKSGDSNSKMMLSIIKTAKELDVPIYYVSTAFLWRESGSTEGPRNAYESDKLNSEKILKDSGVLHTIFRPSVLVGDTESGELINWSGYYLIVAKFLETAKFASSTKVRFPVLVGTSNMIPANQAAETISETVVTNTLGEMIYVTNPEPLKAQRVLDTTLEFFGVRDKFEFVDIDFVDYEKLDRSKEEEVLYLAGKHFSPYWSLAYNFPDSAIKENLITEAYLKKTLGAFKYSNKIGAV